MLRVDLPFIEASRLIWHSLLALHSGWLSPELEHTLNNTTAADAVDFSQPVFIYLELCWHPVFFEATLPPGILPRNNLRSQGNGLSAAFPAPYGVLTFPIPL
jgi:hypothetical protein